jgi:protein-disulfide isomerase/uncharacterized membrane protein
MKRHSRHNNFGPFRLVAGLALLAVGIATSLVLASYHLTGEAGLNCGPQSGCAHALASRWSNIGGWPVAYVALCYFSGAALAWLVSQQFGVGTFLRVVVRLAAIVSLAYLILSWQLQIACPYCLITQGASLAFWLLVETSSKSPELARSAMAFVGGFAVVFAAITVVQSERRWQQAIEPEVEPAGFDLPVDDRRARSQPRSQSTSSGRDSASETMDVATVEVTIYTDYCCPVCVEVDEALAAAAERNEKIVLTVKNYPICTDCNPHTGENLHPNACQAARAAEAARMADSGGDQGFWRMHAWLFQRGGEFTVEELREALPGLGFREIDQFIEAMSSQEVNRRIQADIKQAAVMRVDSTPTIFVNGTQLRNWKDGSGLETAIMAIARRKAR